MYVYEDLKHGRCYKIGDEYAKQNKLFKKIVKKIKRQLPSYLHIKQNNKYSVNIDDYRNRTFVFVKCDKYANKRWRIRITPTDWGETFLEKELLPLLPMIQSYPRKVESVRNPSRETGPCPLNPLLVIGPK